MPKKVCLIDGSGYIFRAFYGLPMMTSPDNTPVNAVYGFSNMFLKLTTRIKCDYCLFLDECTGLILGKIVACCIFVCEKEEMRKFLQYPVLKMRQNA